MTFEEWYLNTFGETVESAAYGHEMGNYTGPPDPHSIKIAWQAATLAERERAAKAVDKVASWIDGYCQSHVVIKEDVLNAIRKGEGV